MKADTELLEQLYHAEDPQEIAEIYSKWAKTYDTDLLEDADYAAPQCCLNILEKYIPSQTACILDGGAGTGLFGQLLHQRGYRSIIGMDVSEGMLEEARKKNVYQELRQEVLGESLSFASNTFDAVASVGVFSPGQGPADAFDELIRVTKPGGYILFTLQAKFYDSFDFGYKTKLLELESAGKWNLEEKTAKFQGLPKSEPELWYNIWAYQVL
jgi:predicted TPR repeat methyltransferase